MIINSDNVEIGKMIKINRIYFNYSRRDIAQKLNIGYQQYARYENNQSRVTIQTLLALSNIYGVTIDQMMQIAANLTKYTK